MTRRATDNRAIRRVQDLLLFSGCMLLPLGSPDGVYQSPVFEVYTIAAVIGGLVLRQRSSDSAPRLGLYAFALLFLLTAASSVNFGGALQSLVSGSVIIILISAASLRSASLAELQTVTRGYLAGVLLSVGVAIISGAFVPGSFAGGAGLSANRSVLAYEVALALTFIAGPANIRKNHVKYALAAVLLFGLLSAGGRGGLVGAVGAFALYPAATSARRAFKIASLAVIGVLAASSVSGGRFAGLDRLLARDERLGASADAFSGNRLERYDFAIRQLPVRPFGSGSADLLPSDPIELVLPIEAHNFLLSSALSAGWFGGLLAVAVLFQIVRFAAKADSAKAISHYRPHIVLLAWSAFTAFPFGSMRGIILFTIIFAFVGRKASEPTTIELVEDQAFERSSAGA